jgi:O-antigen/teichoic acid export membrane protein
MILEAKAQNRELYEKRMTQLYSIVTSIALAQGIVMTVFSKPLVHLLYGAEYASAASILAVAVWQVTFSYYGSVRNVWILAEGKQKYLLTINVSGAIANILLNLALIPLWGGVGAAVASLVTQFFTNVIIGFIFKPIRRNNDLMLRSLHPKVLTEMLKTVLKRR